MKIGYALGGGVGYGFAHIGALKVLEKNNIKPDIIAGTSVGSLIGGLLASGLSINEIENMSIKLSWDKILKFTLPKEGLISIDGLNEFIEKNVKIKNIEQTKIKFAAIATDLCDNKEKVFDRGPISNAIRASCSLPGIFTPYKDGQHIYVDGGLINNVPVKTAFEMGADFVIAIDITAKAFGLHIKQVDIFSILWKSLQLMIQKTIALENLEKYSENLVIITPDISNYNPFDLNKKFEIIKKGEEAANENIELILKKIKEKMTLKDKIKNIFKK